MPKESFRLFTVDLVKFGGPSDIKVSFEPNIEIHLSISTLEKVSALSSGMFLALKNLVRTPTIVNTLMLPPAVRGMAV